ncbi:core-2/I-branching enzyme-domain-containing protein [Geranomyces variabilis]|nr:core-2/I-branching enzyme-domain-containing protein [Geranomyces variabilis]KAJ3143475.1 hypothetical protein HDU90_000236 [Geranomyces variabilis]
MTSFRINLTHRTRAGPPMRRRGLRRQILLLCIGVSAFMATAAVIFRSSIESLSGARPFQDRHSSLTNSAPESDMDDADVQEVNADSIVPSKLHQPRWVPLTGFNYCSILEGATIDSTTEIFALGGGTIADNGDDGVTPEELVALIDDRALQAEKSLMSRYPVLFKSDVHRYVCYSAAEGSNQYMNLTKEPLLHRIDPVSYYSNLIPSLQEAPSPLAAPRRKYSLAYLLMIHKTTVWEQSKLLINALDDGSAVFLIHVDPQAEGVIEAVGAWIDHRDGDTVGNVFVAQTNFEGMWGHASLVWMQLSGFWELLDLADWDYVINLSGYDWPLRSSKEIYKALTRPTHIGKEHIEFWSEPSDIANRITRPHFGRSDRPSVEWSLVHPREVGLRYPPFRSWAYCKQHQWMMLTSSFIRHLRTDADALTLLAYMEHTWIPDESYFCAVIANNPVFSKRVYNDKKRYLRFWGQHPTKLTLDNISEFPPEKVGDAPRYLFVRKVNATEDRELVEWINENHIEKHKGKEIEAVEEEKEEWEKELRWRLGWHT